MVALVPIDAPRLTRGRHDRPVGFGLRRSVRVGGARVAVVGEHHAVADEDLVLDDHAFADEGVRRDLAARADRRVLLDLDESADLRVVADGAAVEVDERRVEDLTSAPRTTDSAIGIVRPRLPLDEMGRLQRLAS